MKQVIMNKPNCLGLSILEVSKILMYLFWHDYVKPKYGEKRNYVTWIQTEPYSLHKKRRYYSGTAKDVETRLDTSNYELDRPLPKEKNNERWIRWENNDSVCPIEVENI